MLSLHTPEACTSLLSILAGASSALLGSPRLCSAPPSCTLQSAVKPAAPVGVQQSAVSQSVRLHHCSSPPGGQGQDMAFISVLAVLALLVSAEGSVGPSTNNSFCTESKECLEYELVCKTDEYEVRRYSPTRWVSTDAEAYFMGVGAAMAFRRLFQYITGANEGGLQMEMTAPVLVKIPEETKMWEPAVYTLNFPLPAAYQDKPPAPTNDKLYFTEMPEMDVYVRSYGGWMLSVTSRLHAHLLTKELERVRASYNHSYHYGVGYDSPLKLLNRHNEVWYVAEGEPVCSDPREPTPAHTPRPTPTNLPTDASSGSQSDAPSNSTSIAQADAPSALKSDASLDLQSDTSSDFQADAPSDSQADAPSDSQEDAPSDSQADAPSDSLADAPSDSEEDAPSDSLADAPSDPQADVLSAPQDDDLSEPLALILYDTPTPTLSNLSLNTTPSSSSQSPSNAPTPSATPNAPPSPSSGLPADAAASHPPTSVQILLDPTSNSTDPASLSPSLEPQPDAAPWNSTTHSSVDTHTGSTPAVEPEGAH